MDTGLASVRCWLRRTKFRLCTRLVKGSALLRGAADYVKLHEVCCAADAHGCACNDADDVAFADEALFEEAFFGDGG